MKYFAFAVLLVGLVAGGVGFWAYHHNKIPGVEVIEKTDVNPPPIKLEEQFTDDVPDPAKAPKFDPERADSRLAGDWQVNLSATYTKLDCPMMRPDLDGELLKVRRNYKEAWEAGKRSYGQLLPSVNMIDGKAKQFDDGLYAALDLAYYRGLAKKLPSHVAFVERLHKTIGPKGEASAFLAAALEIAGKKADCEDVSTKARLLQQFENAGVASKPQGFYTWSEDLKTTFRFLRFLQWEFTSPSEMTAKLVPIQKVIEKDESLKGDYQKMLGFYGKLSNRLAVLSVVDLPAQIDVASLNKAFADKQVTRKAAALLPSSSSKETILFDKLFPNGLPAGADLMRELVKRIRSGEVDLTPGKDAGWYEHQAFALETMLLPKKGQESERLLLTAAYKKRMLEAFKALITKRRETHVRQLSDFSKVASAIAPLDDLEPRLRLEPAPTYYLRTARAYSFLANFLEAAVGESELKSLKGLRQGGERSMDLHSELQLMRRLFYGCYLLSAEDLGMAPALKADEGVDQAACRKEAEGWLKKIPEDPDMAADTRVVVPVFTDIEKGQTHLWATAGVRLARLDVSYLKEFPPSIRPKTGGEWKKIESWKVKPSHYLIPVDEFVSTNRSGLGALNRDEYRALCDKAAGDKEKLVELLSRGE
jgi:hypothetical protein